jgi:hypothetical protein
MNTRNAVRSAGLAIAATVLLAACASPAPVVTPAAVTATPTPEVTRMAAPTPPANPAPEIAWPLTGIDAAGVAPELLARPALSIKIENSKDARPQDNLDQADVVFEEYVESGISRLVAIFHSDVPETLGPIRSMRPMDRDIMGSFKGPLIFSGAQGRFIAETRSTGQAMIAQDIGSYGFYRTSGRSAPHNLHGRTADFFEQSEDLPAPPQQWSFAYPAETATAQVEGEPAARIDIRMSGWAQPDWKWDADAGVWMRYEDTTPHVTMDGTQLYANNVLVLWVKIEYTSNNGGSAVPRTIVVKDNGTGWLASGDKYIEVAWSKAGQFDPFVVTTTDGEPVTFLPGKTWVELVPEGGDVSKGTVEIS